MGLFIVSIFSGGRIGQAETGSDRLRRCIVEFCHRKLCSKIEKAQIPELFIEKIRAGSKKSFKLDKTIEKFRKNDLYYKCENVLSCILQPVF